MGFKAAKCPNCNGELQVPDDRDIVKCMYCGDDIVVREAIKLVLGINVDNTLKLAQASLDTGSYEEASEYFSKILENDVTNSEAWFGKAQAVVRLGTLANLRLYEMVSNFQNAIEYSTEEMKPQMKVRVSNSITEACALVYPACDDHYEEYRDLDSSFRDYANHCIEIINALEIAYLYSPHKNIVNWILHICNNKYTFQSLFEITTPNIELN